jgi:tape measure domain-containing protein
VAIPIKASSASLPAIDVYLATALNLANEPAVVKKMLSKGNVQAEELRGQLGERLPGAISYAAKALGVTTRQLNKMLEQGQVLAEDMIPKLSRVLREELGASAVIAFSIIVFTFGTGKSLTFFPALTSSR